MSAVKCEGDGGTLLFMPKLLYGFILKGVGILFSIRSGQETNLYTNFCPRTFLIMFLS